MIHLYHLKKAAALIKGTNDFHIEVIPHCQNKDTTNVLGAAAEFKMRHIKCNGSLIISSCD